MDGPLLYFTWSLRNNEIKQFLSGYIKKAMLVTIVLSLFLLELFEQHHAVCHLFCIFLLFCLSTFLHWLLSIQASRIFLSMLKTVFVTDFGLLQTPNYSSSASGRAPSTVESRNYSGGFRRKVASSRSSPMNSSSRSDFQPGSSSLSGYSPNYFVVLLQIID